MRIFKEESELEVWKQDDSGRFALLRNYPICRWSGELGPKIKLGDRQAPEGFYTITPWPHESEFQPLSRNQHRVPECIRHGQRPHRILPNDPWRLFVGRLLPVTDEQIGKSMRLPAKHSWAAKSRSSCRRIRFG